MTQVEYENVMLLFSLATVRQCATRETWVPQLVL